MTYIDLILVAVVLVIVYVSIRNGFFKTLFNLMAYVLAVVAAKVVSPIFAKATFDRFIRSGAEEYLSESLSDITVEQLPEKAELVIDSVPDKLRGLLEIIGLNEEKISEQIGSVELESQDIVTSVIDNVVEPIGTAIMQFLIFIILGIIFLIVAKIIVRLLDGVIKKLPVLKGVNSILGGALGIIRGLLFAVVFAGLLGIIASVSDNQAFIDAVSGSVIMNLLTESIGGFSF